MKTSIEQTDLHTAYTEELSGMIKNCVGIIKEAGSIVPDHITIIHTLMELDCHITCQNELINGLIENLNSKESHH